MNAVMTRVGTGLTGLLLLAGATVAQETDVAKEIEELKQGQQQIRQELAEIKRLLEARPRAAQPAQPRRGSPIEGRLFELGDNPVIGEATAKLTLIEFSDYQ